MKLFIYVYIFNLNFRYLTYSVVLVFGVEFNDSYEYILKEET